MAVFLRSNICLVFACPIPLQFNLSFHEFHASLHKLPQSSFAITSFDQTKLQVRYLQKTRLISQTFDQT